MFQYYGSKKRLAIYYQKPQYNTIIEPFAGSAQYSLHGNNWKNEVILYDLYHRVIDIWEYLINEAEKDGIMSLPDMYPGESLNNHTYLSDAERWLIGYYLNPASVSGGVTVSKNFTVAWNKKKIEIANNIYKIKHWTIYKKSYNEIRNKEATWFIDPPYQFNGGYAYRNSSNGINYDNLAEFCRSRNGQVIVCEGKDAKWLDFNKLCKDKFKKEYVWYKG